MEIRSFGNKAAPRIVDERTIEGYAVVFEQQSQVLYNKDKRNFFIEVIKRGAITNELLQSSDVKALVEHDSNRLLARSYKGKGSLQLSVDEHGVKYRFIAPNTADGDYAVEMIKRGDVFGSSFAYLTNEKENIEYSRLENGLILRKVKLIDRFFDVSPVADPAYMGTEVSVRSIKEVFPEKEDQNNEKYKEEVEQLRSLSNE